MSCLRKASIICASWQTCAKQMLSSCLKLLTCQGYTPGSNGKTTKRLIPFQGSFSLE